MEVNLNPEGRKFKPEENRWKKIDRWKNRLMEVNRSIEENLNPKEENLNPKKIVGRK